MTWFWSTIATWLCLADSDRSLLFLNGKYCLKNKPETFALPCHCTTTVFLLSLHKSFFQGFLSDLLEKANRHYDEQKLQEYTQTIVRLYVYETSLLMRLILSYFQIWTESCINLFVQLPLSLKKQIQTILSEKWAPTQMEKNIAHIQYCVKIFKRISVTAIWKYVFWHSYLQKQYCSYSLYQFHKMFSHTERETALRQSNGNSGNVIAA